MYQCEWERIDSPTRDLSETDARAYYKAHAIQGDAVFMAGVEHCPSDIRSAWHALGIAVGGRKETAADRAIAASLRDAWRAWANGDAYALPELPAGPRHARKARTPVVCKNCGCQVAA